MSKTASPMKHELFTINEADLERKKFIRQDRLPVPEKKVFLLIGTLRLEVLNLSCFGISAICAEKDLDTVRRHLEGPSNSSAESVLYFDELEIQKISIRLVRTEHLKYSMFNDRSLGFEVTGNPISMECVKALELADEMIQSSKINFSEFANVPNDFKLIVYEMKDFLLHLKERIGQIEKLAPMGSEIQNSDFRLAVTQSVSDYLSLVIPAKYQKIPSMVLNADEKAMEACTKFIRLHLGSLIYDAPFANRAFYKPRGYAGDYEMMNHLYRSESVGETLFDQCMHRYLIEEPAAQAVKNRGLYLFEKIKQTVAKSSKSKIRILAVASGPAKEQQLFLQNCSEFSGKNVEFVCIDQDDESLKHAQRELHNIERFARTGHQFKFINLAIKNILVKGLPEGDFDLIYTAGLFDYFTDIVATSAARTLFNGLADSGEMIIGNFSTANPTRALMEMILDWHLIYRSHEDMIRLFSNIGKSVEVEQEKLGINLFAIIKK